MTKKDFLQKLSLTALIIIISGILRFFILHVVNGYNGWYFFYTALIFYIILSVVSFGFLLLFYFLRKKSGRDLRVVHKIWQILLWFSIASFVLSAIFDLWLNDVFWSKISLAIYLLPYALLIMLSYWAINIDKK